MSATAHTGLGSGADRFRALYQLLAALSRASALEELYEAALTNLLDATAADRVAILLFDDDGVTRFKASRGLSPAYQAAVTGHSPWPRGALDAEAVAVPDVLLDESLAAYRDVLRQEGIRALLFVPLALDAGVFGKFMLYYAAPHESRRVSGQRHRLGNLSTCSGAVRRPHLAGAVCTRRRIDLLRLPAFAKPAVARIRHANFR